VRRGEIWWASLRPPSGSGPGFRRPVLVIQSNDFNESRIQTVVIAAITTNLALASAPGNVLCRRHQTGLPRESVVNVSQLLTVDKRFLAERAGALDARTFGEVEEGIRLVLAL
jgi:mRNA interferase MazF